MRKLANDLVWDVLCLGLIYGDVLVNVHLLLIPRGALEYETRLDKAELLGAQ